MKYIKNRKVLLILISIILVLIIVYILVNIAYSQEVVSMLSYADVQENYEQETVQAIPKNVTSVVPIFMYHFVTDEKIDAPDIENYMTTTKLEEQLKYIVDNKYEPVYISEFGKLYTYTKPVAITIDDGFLFYNTTFKLLKKYNVKATLSIITDYINTPRYLTTDQIKEIRDSGIVDIQSHTLSHRKLATLSVEEMQKEIINSDTFLKDNYNIDPTVLCYPIGSYNKKTIEIAKASYDYGLKMDGGIYYSNKHSLFEIPRIYAYRSMPINTYISYLKNAKVEVEW